MTKTVRDFDLLPARVQDVLRGCGVGTAGFVLALKSDFKPNATIPSLWFVVTHDRLLFCNTHKTRGLWGSMQGVALGDLDLCRASLGQPYFTLRSDEQNTYIPFPRDTVEADLDALASEIKRLRER